MTDQHVIWFRRDLRLHDHAPLAAALASCGPVLPLYIFDPEEWRQPGRSARQFAFLLDTLNDLDKALRARGSALCLRTGPAGDVLARLHRDAGITAIHTYEATGDAFARQRDAGIRKWALKAGVGFREQATNGVGEHSARGDAWIRHVRSLRHKAPDRLPAPLLDAGFWPEAEDMGLAPDPCPNRQPGGRDMARLMLQNFLSGRGRNYRIQPRTIMEAESFAHGLSAHLSLGSVSAREVWQVTERARQALADDGDHTFVEALNAFQQGLYERCRLRQTDQMPVLTPTDRDVSGKISAWLGGQTGFPLIDAGMRALSAQGTIPDILAAALLGFARQHLWVEPGVAALSLQAGFTDHDPDCLYKREQHPAQGHPVRTSRTLDPDGLFIRRWVPELRSLTGNDLHAPWEAPKYRLNEAGIVLGQSYPMRMVDHTASIRRGTTASAQNTARSRRHRQLSLDFGPAPAA